MCFHKNTVKIVSKTVYFLEEDAKQSIFGDG